LPRSASSVKGGLLSQSLVSHAGAAIILFIIYLFELNNTKPQIYK
jgi:hypothetical protein